MTTMLILRGLAGTYAGRKWPRGALFEQPALEYAKHRGYTGRVLDVAGTPGGANSEQVRQALAAIRGDTDIQALYGFSQGGYNIRHILRALTVPEQIRLVVVLGAPKNAPALFRGPWELVYRLDPPTGHMDGPAALAKEPTIVTRN